ncbi:MAG: ABC transporter permease [Acidisphaera sp.]|nr:ABC transporter permease [Acidisphaera sp.]
MGEQISGAAPAVALPTMPRRARGGTLRTLLRSRSFVAGAVLLLLLVAFTLVGSLVIDTGQADPLSVPPNQPPSWDLPFGSDSQGRDLFCVLILGTGLTLKVGLLAGLMGVAIGTAVGLVAAYYGGWVDLLLRWAIDVGLTIPPLLLLIVIASGLQGHLDTTGMALIIGILSWFGPARQIRAQALVLRRSGYVLTARLGGMRGAEIIFLEIMPNLLPYLMASLVLATSAAILSEVGLEALGLGPMDEPTLGMTVYWMLYYAAFLRGLWWWILTPVLILVVLFVGLYLVSQGLDSFANPRLRQRLG